MGEQFPGSGVSLATCSSKKGHPKRNTTPEDTKRWRRKLGRGGECTREGVKKNTAQTLSDRKGTGLPVKDGRGGVRHAVHRGWKREEGTLTWENPWG